MASVPEKFKTLASQWEADTRFLSSATKMAEHPACQQIIDMGEDVVPLVLGRLVADPDVRWFEVLARITGANPVVPKADCGKMQRVARAWLEWAGSHGYDIRVPAGTCVMPNSPLARGVAQFLMEDG